MNQENAVINYSMAVKNYNQNGRVWSMRKFCEDEGYDYNKFMQCARKGHKSLSVLQEADSNQSESSFIPLVVESAPSDTLGIAEVRVRFTNGMELCQSDEDVNELFDFVRKILVSCYGNDVKRIFNLPVLREKGGDSRKGISGLSGIVKSALRMNPNTPKSIYVFSGRNPRIKKELVREYNRYELTQISLDSGKCFSPITDSNRKYGKISWSDLVMLTEASVSGNVRAKYID